MPSSYNRATGAIDAFTTGTLTGVVPGADHGSKAEAINKIEAQVVKEAPLNVKWPEFGATGDGTTNDASAIQAAIDTIPAVTGGGEVHLPRGVYKLDTGLSWDNKSVRFFGAVPANSMPSGTPSGAALLAAVGVTAVTFKNGTNGSGARSSVENLHIASLDSGSGSACGVKLRANGGGVMGCAIEGFGGHGIHVLSGQDGSPFVVDGVNNANGWYLERVRCYNNFNHGVFVEGVDSNAGVAVQLDCAANDGYGVYDNSAFGNTYVGPHFDGNVTAAIRIGAQSGYNRFEGVYKEGDSNPAVLIDAGGDGHNRIDFRVLLGNAGETITDNHALPWTNTISARPAAVGVGAMQPGVIAGPQWASPTTVALVASTAFVARVVPSRAMKVTKISFVVTTAAGADDAADVGVYDSAGTRLASKGTTAGLLNSTGVKTVTLASPPVLDAGKAYYAALSCGTLGGTAAIVLARTVNAANGSVIFGTTLANVEHGYYSTSHPLPSTVGTTPTANNTNPLVAVRED